VWEGRCREASPYPDHRHIEEIVIRIDERLAATLPTLATKAELAEFKADVSTSLPNSASKSPTSRAGFTCGASSQP